MHSRPGSPSPGPAAQALDLRPGDRVAVIGSGGKTTLLRRLAREGQGGVLLTTTTKMAPPGSPEDPPYVPFRDFEGFARSWAALEKPRRALTGRYGEGERKMCGLLPEEIDALSTLPDLDLLGVEADGSRCLPAKTHDSYEPVLFSSCTVGVAVLGMQALGRRVREGEVHRPHLMRERFGLAEGHPLDLEDLERIALSYLEKLPGVRSVLVLSQAEAVGEEVLRELAGRLRRQVGRLVRQDRRSLEVLA